VSARPLPVPVNPALLKHADQRRQHLENRIADQITRFAGSMLFVYLHVIWFAAWILLGVEHYPYGRPSSKKSSKTSSCWACPTRSWSSPGPSTP
jgi:hypothetical protein